MICPDCKRQNPSDAVYCENCGSELQAAPQAPGSASKRSTRIEGLSPLPSAAQPPAPDEFWRPPAAAAKPKDPFAISVSAPGRGPAVPPAVPSKRSTSYDPGAAPPLTDPFSLALTPSAPVSPSQGPYFLAPRPSGLKVIGWLVTFDEAPDGFSFVLTEGRNSIGRDEDRDLRIENGKVSGRHCCIQHRSNPDGTSRTWVFDENSTNGTVLNGNDIFTDRPELRDGDVLKIGAAQFLVKLIDQAYAAQLWPKRG